MRLLPALAATLLISTAASAQPVPDAAAPPQPDAGAPALGGAMAPGPPGGRHMNWRQRFDAANTSHDGKLTREQAQVGGMPGIAHHFEQVDTDKKGYITLQDLRAYAQARRAEKAAQAQQQQPQQ